MDDYGTRRLDAESEEPEPNDEEQEGEAQDHLTPPPLPPTEEETPAALPAEEEEAITRLPEPDIVTPPPVPEEPEEEEPQSPVVFYQAPSGPQESGESEPFRSSTSDSYGEGQTQLSDVPSPFEEPVIQQEPYLPAGEGQRPVSFGGVAPDRGGGEREAVPSGPGSPRKKNQTGIIIAIVVVVLLLLCCCFGLIVLGLMPGRWGWSYPAIGATLPNLLLLLA